MKIAGIVAEYNPFHNGHAHHIERTRAIGNGCEATHVVAVMSGNFVQRGEPALLPKSDRVRMALVGGVDLVLELPVPWALASAEGFAFGAVSILDALGCVEMISFGSECGQTDLLNKAVDAMESARFSPLLRYHLEGGIPFPEARQKAVSEIAGIKTAALLENANNTLGMEYSKALRRLNSPIVPFTVQRFGAEHDARAPMGDMASASYIRTLVQADRLLNASPFIPAASCTILNDAAQEGHCPANPVMIERAVLAKLRTLARTELAALPGISEGLENRIYESVRQAGSLAELMERIKTKRYPLTRIQRIVWSAFIGITAGYEKQKPPYIRVLGANERGVEILGAAHEPQLPILSRPAQVQKLDGVAQQVWEWESRAADLYALALPKPLPCGTEYTTGMIR